jgi:hypothetical protein
MVDDGGGTRPARGRHWLFPVKFSRAFILKVSMYDVLLANSLCSVELKLYVPWRRLYLQTYLNRIRSETLSSDIDDEMTMDHACSAANLGALFDQTRYFSTH